MAKQKETSEIQLLSVEELEPNRGQIYGLPKNPRFIKDDRFNALKKSLSELPEMTKFRPCIVYPADNGKYVVIAGNMRFRAAVDLGWKKVSAIVLPKETPVAKLRAITIKDNVAFGSTDWDIIANEWDFGELKDLGMDDPFFHQDISQSFEQPTCPPPSVSQSGYQAQESVPESALPEELQGRNLDDPALEKIEGDDEVPYERVIIVFEPGEREALENLLGIKLNKVVFHAKEFLNKA